MKLSFFLLAFIGSAIIPSTANAATPVSRTKLVLDAKGQVSIKILKASMQDYSDVEACVADCEAQEMLDVFANCHFYYDYDAQSLCEQGYASQSETCSAGCYGGTRDPEPLPGA